MDEKSTHDLEHNSKTNPVPDCEFCKREVRRRRNRCFGDGMSSLPAPKKEND